MVPVLRTRDITSKVLFSVSRVQGSAAHKLQFTMFQACHSVAPDEDLTVPADNCVDGTAELRNSKNYIRKDLIYCNVVTEINKIKIFLKFF